MTYAKQASERINSFLNENLNEKQLRALKVFIIVAIVLITLYLAYKHRDKIIAVCKKYKKVLFAIAITAIAVVIVRRHKAAKAAKS